MSKFKKTVFNVTTNNIKKLTKAILENELSFRNLFCKSFIGKVNNPVFSGNIICVTIQNDHKVIYKVNITEDVSNWLCEKAGINSEELSSALSNVDKFISKCFDNENDAIEHLWNQKPAPELLELYLGGEHYMITVLDDELAQVFDLKPIEQLKTYLT